MSKQKRQKMSASQKLFLAMSLFIAGTMVLSLFIYALPEPSQPEPTPLPTTISPTRTPEPLPTQAPPLEPSATPPVEIGPILPTATPTLTPTLVPTTVPAAAATAAPLAAASATSTATGAASGVETATVAGTSFTFDVAGDSRDGPAVYSQVLAGVQADDSQFLIHLGDLVNPGTVQNWLAFQKQMAGFTKPFYPVPGNHDLLNGTLDNYAKYSGAPTLHYSFDVGQVHFTFVDSANGGISASELAWLRADLAATQQPVKMVFLHHPPFDPDGSTHVMAYGANGFTALMAEDRVQYVFAGHIHTYAQGERDGVLYTISGGAGAPLYTQGHPLASYHYLHVVVNGEQVKIDVVKVQG